MNFRPRHISEDQFKEMESRVKRDAQGKGERGHGIRVTNHSVGDPSPKPIYKSKWEAAYASKLEMEKLTGLVKFWKYEPFSIWLPGGIRYKPDFLVQNADSNSSDTGFIPGDIEIVEVKGWSKNLRDGMTRLKIAAAIFPCFTWRIVRMQRGGGFVGEYI